MTRPDPQAAATALIETRYPACDAAFMAGSIVRGEGTATSDIDLVVITTRPEAPYRELLVTDGWPVEAFVHSTELVRRYFQMDTKARRPMLPMMCAEGIILRDREGVAGRIKAEAQALLDAGPASLTPEERDDRRYALTDLLDDFEGCDRPEELLYIAPGLAAQAADFVLAFNGRWCTAGKWIPRSLRRYDPALAARLTAALEAVYHTGEREPLVAFVDAVLAPAGGRLFAGYMRAGQRPPEDGLEIRASQDKAQCLHYPQESGIPRRVHSSQPGRGRCSTLAAAWRFITPV